MRVALVWPTIDAKRADQDVRRRISALAERHDVVLWTHPAAVGRLRRRLRALTAVRGLTHPDTASRLESLDADLVVVFHPSTARKAAKSAPPEVPLAYWSLAGPRFARGGDSRRDEIDVLAALAPQFDAVLCDSAESRHRVLERLGPHAVPVISTASSGPMRRPGSVAGGAKTMVAGGALVASAGFGDVIRAFDESGTADHGWQMHLHGKGEHGAKLDQLAQWRDLGSSIAFEADGAMETALDSASLLVTPGTAPSREELALDAAARGVPVVGFEGDPVASLVVAGGGGILVPAGATQALGAALAHIASDADVLADYSTRAHEAASLLGAEGAARWVAVLEMLGRHRSRRARAGRGVGPVRTRSGVKMRAALEADVRRALQRAEISHTCAPEAGGDGMFVAAAEDVATGVDTLLDAELGALQLYVGNDPAHTEQITKREDIPPFVTYINRVDVLSDDPRASVSIDFWRKADGGVRHAPRRNAEADWVGPATWRDWLTASRRTVTGLPLWQTIDFPVDAVFTWVDGADPAWLAKRDEYLSDGRPGRRVAGSDGASDDRFINRDEIYYSVAAARRNLPWLRRIIVVVDGQRHARIQADFPEVEFVDHTTIFPDPGVLPVFNSHAIEACLHRIPGLAERFLYINDDVFVTKPLPPSAFFDANGVARFFPSELKINFDDNDSAEPHLHAAANNRQLIAADFGVEITNTMLHTPHPHLRSVLEEMEGRYHDVFARTQSSRFRDSSDVSVLSSFAQYYGWVTKNYAPGTLEYRFVRLHAKDLGARLDRVQNDEAVQVVCLGEPLAGQSRHEDELALTQRFMEDLVPADNPPV